MGVERGDDDGDGRDWKTLLLLLRRGRLLLVAKKVRIWIV